MGRQPLCSVDEPGASADECPEPVAVERSRAGLGGLEKLVAHRHAARKPEAARPLGRALAQRDCCINGEGAIKGWQSGAAGTSSVAENRYKTLMP